jgi:hypothetical protein
MEITPYNHHCEGSFLPSVFVLKQRLPGRIKPSLLSNQFKLPLLGWGFERLKIEKPEAKCTSVYNWIEIRCLPSFLPP